METLLVSLSDAPSYDQIIKNSLPEGGDLRIITKDNALESGGPGAMITFTVQLPDGSIATAQAATTVRNLQMLGIALNARYGNLQ